MNSSAVSPDSLARPANAGGRIAVAWVIGAVIGLFIACILWPDLWDWLGVYHLRLYYADFAAILAASDARAAGADPYIIPAPFDPFGRPHVYGPWWLYLHKLGLSRDSLPWVGTMLCFASVSALAWALKPRSWEQRIVAILLLASPPLLLAYERGNNDLVVALFLLTAGVFGSSGAGLVGRCVCVWATAALKFYPVAALGMVIHGRGGRKWRAVACTCVAGLLTWGIWREDFARAFSAVPQPSTLYSYGARLVLDICVALPSWTQRAVYVGALGLGGAAIAMAGAFSGRAAGAMTRDTRAGAWFVGAGGCWTFCFLLNTNFPYRTVLLVLASSVWFELWRECPLREGTVGRRLLWLLAGMLWLRLARVWLAYLAWDDFAYPGLVLLGIEHGFSIGFTAVVGRALARLGWERVRNPARREAVA